MGSLVHAALCDQLDNLLVWKVLLKPFDVQYW
jgi:hypothetical protein